MLDVVRASRDCVPLDEVLRLITRSARQLLGASDVGVVLRHPDGTHEVRTDGGTTPGYEARLRRASTATRSGAGLAAAAVDGVDPQPDDDVFVLVPVETEVSEPHFLGVWFAGRARPLDDEERGLLGAFARQVGVTMTRTRWEEDRIGKHLRAERERLSRELHDVVVQRVFSAGLHLRALTRDEDLDTVRTGVEDVAAALDLTMRELRSAISGLTRATGRRLRDDVRALAAEYALPLGFSPQVLLTGDLEGVDPVVVPQLLAALRELLSNVVRHARASTCRVAVQRAEDRVVLEVADDGRGIDPRRPRSGLENLRLRASLLGGDLTLEQTPGGGTTVRWQVPDHTAVTPAQ